jgi:hypothetical protein
MKMVGKRCPGKRGYGCFEKRDEGRRVFLSVVRVLLVNTRQNDRRRKREFKSGSIKRGSKSHRANRAEESQNQDTKQNQDHLSLTTTRSSATIGNIRSVFGRVKADRDSRAADAFCW